MPTWAWILIAIAAVLAVVAVVWAALAARRRKHLQDRFGPEYDRTVTESGSRREAETELAAREKRRAELEIRPLSDDERVSYRERWQRIQSEFVDSPLEAVQDADGLIRDLMRTRGYPVDDFESRAADVSVDHPDVVENYRAGHRISEESARGEAGTEDLRQAMVHYRSLFDELVEAEAGEPVGQEAR